MSLINKVRRPATGVVPGGKYAGGLVPNQQGNGMGIGRDGYLQMLDNIKNGRMPTSDQTARLGIQQPATPAPATNPLVAGIAALQAAAAPATAQTPASTPQAATPTSAPATQPPAQPRGLSISNGVDSGGSLQITNGFDAPDPTPAAQPAQPAAQSTQQPQKFARGRVPNALIDGIVRGEGGPTEDKVPAKVSPQEAILPAKTVQALGGPAAIRALIERTNDGKQPESEVEQGGKYADGAVPGFFDDLKNALARPDTGISQDVGAIKRAVGDFSGASRQMPDIPAEDAAAYAARRPLAAAAAPASPSAATIPDSGRNPLSAPSTGLASAAKPAQPAPAQNALAAAPAAADTVSTGPAPGFRLPDAPPEMRGAEYANRQLEALRGQNEGGPKVAVIEDGSKQDRRAFDNFVTRSNAESAYRDAVRSGRPQNIQAAGGSLAALTQVGDNQEMKAGEFQRGMEALRAKGAQDQETDNNRARNALAQYALQGRNALMGEAMRGSNALDLENLRGANQRYVNPLAADAMRIRNQLDATKLADATSLQTMQTRMLAETDPAKRQEMVDQILALQGREPSNRYSTNVVHGTKIKDSQGNETTTNPLSITTDLRTGQTTSQRLGGESGQYLQIPADKAKMVTGQTYQTARGPARWDGKQFVGL